MELFTIFAISVGAISACHLTFSAVNFIGKGIYNRGHASAKRDDWYCFFKTSHLLGMTQPTTTSPPQAKQRRQQQPRMQA